MNLAIFLKAPVAGKVKTRLCPPLRPEEAASLYRAFLLDLLSSAAQTAARRIWLYHDGAHPQEYLPEDLLQRLDTPLGRLMALPQADGDLGARLRRAMDDARARRALPLLVVGSDHPDLPPLYLNHTMIALAGQDLVLGEAEDGGTWCIGAGRGWTELFQDIPWSRPSTRAALVRRARKLGLRHRVMERWWDVDDLDDLRALWHRLQDGRSCAPHSHRWLREWSRRELLERG